MTKEEKLLKELVGIAKETEADIKELKADKTLEDPIDGDFVRTKKSMGYELMLSKLKTYVKSRK